MMQFGDWLTSEKRQEQGLLSVIAHFSKRDGSFYLQSCDKLHRAVKTQHSFIAPEVRIVWFK